MRASGRRSRRRAGTVRRVAAWAVDLVVPAALAAGMITLGWWDPPALYEDPTLPLLERMAVTVAWGWAAGLRALVVLHLPWVLWHATWGVLTRETPGARLARIELVDRDGLPAGPGQRLLRAALLLTWPLSLYGVALVSAVVPSGRGLADVLAGVVAVDAER